MERKKKEIIKMYSIIVLGIGPVGKTCLIHRYLKGEFIYCNLCTIGIERLSSEYVINGKEYGIHLLDTTGAERFASLAKQYLRKVNGIIFVYSIDDRHSFNSINKWYEICQNSTNKGPIGKVLIGNKCDHLKREVSFEEGETLAKKLRMKFFEVSSKTGIGVVEAFCYIIEHTIEVCHLKIYKFEKLALVKKKKEKSKNNYCQT